MFVGMIVFFIMVIFIKCITSIPEYGSSMLIATIILGFGLYIFFKESLKFNNKTLIQKAESNIENNSESTKTLENETDIFEYNIEIENENKYESPKEYTFPTKNLLD